LANECVYQIKPSAFPAYRTLIFANQNVINTSNVRELLLGLGDDAGVDRTKLAACMDSKATLSRVEAGHQEGEDLGIHRTPTSFVNGRIVIGLPPEATWDKIIGEALLAGISSQ
jgi:protein-disulfide isomerase